MNNLKNCLIAFIVFQSACFNVKSQSVSPVKTTSGNYGFTFANIYFEVNPAYGGRVSSLIIDSTQLLYVATIGQPNGSDNAGSTFWPSPQSVWNWPPPTELSYNKYSVDSTNGELIVHSNKNAAINLSFRKVYTVNPSDTSITIQYYMKNWATTAKSWAPWEITRINANGLTFFAVGSGAPTGIMASNAKILGTNAWYCQDSTTVPAGTAKFNCDGKGWLAHKTDSRYLLIKTFPDIKASQSPSGEAEVECYTSPDHVYTELEDQGAYTSIAAGDSLKWQTKWYVRKLPSGIKGVSGETALLNYVNTIMKTDTVFTNINHSNLASIMVYPNPVVENLTIVNPDAGNGNSIVSILNLQGQLVFQKEFSGTIMEMNLKSYSPGLYIIKINNNYGNSSFSKIIIKK